MSSFFFHWKEKTQIKETLNLVTIEKENLNKKVSLNLVGCNNGRSLTVG